MSEQDSQQQAATNSIPGAVMARLLDLTERRLQQLAREGVIPKAGRGMYPLAATVNAYVKYLKDTGDDDGQIDPEKLTPFKRKAFYQAETAKLALMEERRELMPRIEFEQEQGRVAKIVTQALESLPDILERDAGATPAQVAKAVVLIDKLREEIYAALIAPEPENANSAISASA